MRDFLAVNLTIEGLARRYDELFLNQLLDIKRFNTNWARKEVEDWCAEMDTRLGKVSAPSVRYGVRVIQGEEGDEVLFSKTTHGVTVDKPIKAHFFKGPEYRLIGGLADTLQGLIQDGATVQRGKAREDISSFREAYSWLMSESKKGRSIQRFKGLGEMNPDQLWDTTVNPETRRLLQVTIEDAVAADQIFTTLMGDEVEPRRDFIEKNALDAANLDV
jgi:DNA gyrase subunit B